MRLQIITNSERTTLLTCGLRHRFAYIDLLRPIVSAEPLRTGNLMHDGIQAGWEAAWSAARLDASKRLGLAETAAIEAIANQTAAAVQDAYQFDERARLIDEANKACELMSWAVPNYFRKSRDDLECVPVLIEGGIAFRVRNAAGQRGLIEYRGQVDLVLWDMSNNRLIVEDHKSTSTSVDALEGKLALDTQLTGYVAGLQELVERIKANPKLVHELPTTKEARATIAANFERFTRATIGSVAFNVVRKKKPETPKINLIKKGQCTTTLHSELLAKQTETGEHMGEVSVAQIDTTPELYREALEAQLYERELAITDKQKDLLRALEARRSSYFAKLELYRSQDEIERWSRELYADAKRLRENEREAWRATRNPGACTGPASPACPYAALCSNPDDPTIRKSFRVAASKHEELTHGKEEDSNEQDSQQAAGLGF